MGTIRRMATISNLYWFLKNCLEPSLGGIVERHLKVSLSAGVRKYVKSGSCAVQGSPFVERLLLT